MKPNHSLFESFVLPSSAIRVYNFMKMALNTRLLGRSVLGCPGLRPVFISQIRPVTIRARPAAAPIEESHDEKNMRLGRPQSPHLTIYKPQLTSMLSITHRFTGMILGGYAGTFAVVSLLSSKPMAEVIQNIAHCYPTFFVVFKMGLIFPFTYHFFNGIRHLVWDFGFGFSVKSVYISGYLMFLSSIAAAGGIIYFAEELKRIECEKAEKMKKAKQEAERAKALEEEKNKKSKKKKK